GDPGLTRHCRRFVATSSDAGEPGRQRVPDYTATLWRKPSMLPRRLSAAFSTACDAASTVSAALCMSAMAPETRCSTPTTDFVPEAAAATLSDISPDAAFCCSTEVAMAPVNC